MEGVPSPLSCLSGHHFPWEFGGNASGTNAQLDELKFQLMCAHQLMKNNEDKHRRDVHFVEGDDVFLKLQPYRQKSLACNYNEKLTPRFYGPYKIKKNIGKATYELLLPSYSRIHPVFHVSQLMLAKGTYIPNSLHVHIVETLELKARPDTVMNTRYRIDGALELLIQWAGLPRAKETWEEASLLAEQYPDFHLENKVRLHIGGIVMPFIKAKPWITYQRKLKQKQTN